jgi:hypothetical protein
VHIWGRSRTSATRAQRHVHQQVRQTGVVDDSDFEKPVVQSRRWGNCHRRADIRRVGNVDCLGFGFERAAVELQSDLRRADHPLHEPDCIAGFAKTEPGVGKPVEIPEQARHDARASGLQKLVRTDTADVYRKHPTGPDRPGCSVQVARQPQRSCEGFMMLPRGTGASTTSLFTRPRATS